MWRILAASGGWKGHAICAAVLSTLCRHVGVRASESLEAFELPEAEFFFRVGLEDGLGIGLEDLVDSTRHIRQPHWGALGFCGMSESVLGGEASSSTAISRKDLMALPDART